MIIPISIVIPFQAKNSKIHLWTQVRISNDELNGLFEFPGGKIEASESPALAGIREVKEEVGIDIDSNKLIKIKNYPNQVDGKTILLMAFAYDDTEGSFMASGYRDLDELINISEKLPPANREILLDLKQSLLDICVKTNT